MRTPLHPPLGPPPCPCTPSKPPKLPLQIYRNFFVIIFVKMPHRRQGDRDGCPSVTRLNHGGGRGQLDRCGSSRRRSLIHRHPPPAVPRGDSQRPGVPLGPCRSPRMKMAPDRHCQRRSQHRSPPPDGHCSDDGDKEVAGGAPFGPVASASARIRRAVARGRGGWSAVIAVIVFVVVVIVVIFIAPGGGGGRGATPSSWSSSLGRWRCDRRLRALPASLFVLNPGASSLTALGSDSAAAA